MALLQLNIGLNVNGVEKLDAMQVSRMVASIAKPITVGPNLFGCRPALSGESTVTAALLVKPLGEVELHHLINSLCAEFEQDCIAGIYNGEGFLIGPNTAPYGGAFNPTYWIAPPTINPKIIDMRALIDAFDCVAFEHPDHATRSGAIDAVNAIRAKIKSIGGC